jgi:ParB family chromosome partitioning protein
MNPVDEARAFRRYVDDYGYGGVSELARKIGKSQEYVSNRLRLLSLPRKVREEVIRRLITPSAAQELASLDDDTSEVVEMIREQHLSTREVRRIVKHHRQTSQQGEPSFPDLHDRYPEASESMTRMIDRALARVVAL